MAVVITSSKNVYRIGGADPPILTASGTTGPVTWSCNHGGICIATDDPLVVQLAFTENISRYAALGDPYTVTLHDDGGNHTFALDVYSTFIIQPDWAFKAPVAAKMEFSPAADGTEISFVGPATSSWSLAFNDRSELEYHEALRFWYYHVIGGIRLFYFLDIGLSELPLGRFDSEINRQPDWSDGISYSWVFKCPRWQPSPSLLTETSLFSV
jgi:hypothetical protein